MSSTLVKNLLKSIKYGMFSPSSRSFFYFKTEAVLVELNWDKTTAPWFGEGFYIYKFTDHVHNTKTLHNAYHIEVKDVDLHFLVADTSQTYFEAWHAGNDQVLIKKPSGPFGFLKSASEEDDAMAAGNYTNARSLEANKVTRNSIVNNLEKHWKYHLLVFKEAKHGLNNDIFSLAEHDGKIESHKLCLDGKGCERPLIILCENYLGQCHY